MGYAKAYGKLILIGEHSVVYGKMALAIPFKEVFSEVYITKKELKDHYLISSYYEGYYLEAPELLKGICHLVEIFTKKYNIKEKLEIKINSNILDQRGLGSSASVSKALVVALYDYLQVNYTNDDLINYLKISEEIHHGNPSGLDMYVIVYEKPVILHNGKLEIFDKQLNGFLVVADTGIKSHTKDAVMLVKDKYLNNFDIIDYILKDMDQNAFDILEAISEDDEKRIGFIFNKAQQYLKKLGVSNPKLDLFCEVSINSKALGAKLTGGGLGGCMFAYTNSYEQAQVILKNLEKAGAKKSWIYPL